MILGILDLISIRDRTKIGETEFQHFVARLFAASLRVQMTVKTVFQRVAFSPGEFATLFGKSQTWGYRQIYAGRVKTITEHGRILIPAAEVERILGNADIYSGREPTPSVRARLAKLKPEQQTVWKRFVAGRRRNDGKEKTVAAVASASKAVVSRNAALARLTAKRKPSARKR